MLGETKEADTVPVPCLPSTGGGVEGHLVVSKDVVDEVSAGSSEIKPCCSGPLPTHSWCQARSTGQDSTQRDPLSSWHVLA